MNESTRYEDLEFQEKITERRVTGLWGAVGALIFVVILLAAWNILLLRSTQRAHDGLARAFASMDSMRVTQLRSAEQAKKLDARIAELAQLEERIRTRASAGTVAGLGASVRSLDERVTLGEERLEQIASTVRGQTVELAGLGDRLADLNRIVEEESPARFAALEEASAAERARIAALDREMQSLRSSYSRARWFSAASDVLGLVNLGIIVPHVADHTGRP